MRCKMFCLPPYNMLLKIDKNCSVQNDSVYAEEKEDD